jgi:transcriptional regulator with AAA-type ATPase domain
MSDCALPLLVGSCFQSEERRSRALQPYLVSTPKRGVIGNSKYADRLRRQVGDGWRLRCIRMSYHHRHMFRSHVCAAQGLGENASALAVGTQHMLQVLQLARDPERKPVKIFGEPGLEKDNIAALLHFGSADRNKPMVKVRAR